MDDIFLSFFFFFQKIVWHFKQIIVSLGMCKKHKKNPQKNNIMLMGAFDKYLLPYYGHLNLTLVLLNKLRCHAHF